MNPLARTIKATLAETPMQFGEVTDAHRAVPWREFLQTWGELRRQNILKRDEIGRYYVEGGPAEAIAAATKAE